MKLCVILPVYNAEKYLKMCLDSLLNQTFSDFIIIAINDASTDNSGKILDEYASKWPRNIIRSKGVIWFSDEEDMAYVLETSGRQIQAGYSGNWLASCPPAEQKRVLAEEPEMKKDWDEKVGDRMIKMVIIGRHLDKEEISKALDACLD